jgi:hypothetical protein
MAPSNVAMIAVLDGAKWIGKVSSTLLALGSALSVISKAPLPCPLFTLSPPGKGLLCRKTVTSLTYISLLQRYLLS